VPPVTDAVEARHGLIVTAHRFAVNHAGALARPGQRLDDQREAIVRSLPGRL
jgi:hypothetical protein